MANLRIGDVIAAFGQSTGHAKPDVNQPKQRFCGDEAVLLT
jgi:hypothetical protein